MQFASGKAAFNRAQTGRLDKLGEVMKSNKNLKIEIQGHTDNTGSRAYNLSISDKRANAVKSYLSSRYSVETDRIVAKGYGPDMPRNDNATRAGRKMNRRVEAKIISQ